MKAISTVFLYLSAGSTPLSETYPGTGREVESPLALSSRERFTNLGQYFRVPAGKDNPLSVSGIQGSVRWTVSNIFLVQTGNQNPPNIFNLDQFAYQAETFSWKHTSTLSFRESFINLWFPDDSRKAYSQYALFQGGVHLPGMTLEGKQNHVWCSSGWGLLNWQWWLPGALGSRILHSSVLQNRVHSGLGREAEFHWLHPSGQDLLNWQWCFLGTGRKTKTLWTCPSGWVLLTWWSVSGCWQGIRIPWLLCLSG